MAAVTSSYVEAGSIVVGAGDVRPKLPSHFKSRRCSASEDCTGQAGSFTESSSGATRKSLDVAHFSLHLQY